MTFGGDIPLSGEESYGGEDDEDLSGQSYGDDDDDSVGGGSGNIMYSDEEGVSVDLPEEEKQNMDPAAVAERKKQRRIDKIEKKIKALQKRQEKSTTVKPSRGKYEKEASGIKNKHKR